MTEEGRIEPQIKTWGDVRLLQEMATKRFLRHERHSPWAYMSKAEIVGIQGKVMVKTYPRREADAVEVSRAQLGIQSRSLLTDTTPHFISALNVIYI